jgi:hypothetical protein
MSKRFSRFPAALTATVLGVIWIALSPGFHFSEVRKSPFGGDFMQEWVGGWVILNGLADQIYSPGFTDRIQHDSQIIGFSWDENRVFPMVYPPFYYALVSPLANLSLRTAAWIWLALMSACLVASSLLLAEFMTRVGTNHWVSDWWLPFALMFPPTVESLTTNQKSTLCLLIFLATWWLLDQGRSLMAGLIFGLILFKPQFAAVLLAAMVVRRDLRFLAGFFLTAGVFTILSLIVSTTASRQFVEFASGAMSYVNRVGYDVHESHCWRAFFSPFPATTANRLTIIADLIVLLAAVITARRWQAGQPSLCHGFAGVTLASVLISPHLYSYDLTLLLIPIAVFIGQYLQAPAGSRRVLLLAWTALLFSSSLISETIAQRTGIQLSVLLLAASLFMLTWNWGIAGNASQLRSQT